MLNWSTFGRLRKRLIVGIAFALVVACPASAQMYSDAELNTKLARIRSNLVATVEQDIPQFVDPTYGPAVKALTIELPLRGEHPMDFHAIGKKIVIPLEGLQFIDDLASLRAWLDRYQCESENLLFANYLYYLTRRARFTDPLTAFGLSRAALWRDPFINDISEKFYTSAAWFIIAHEIGHVALGHRGQRGEASVAQSALPTLSRSMPCDGAA